MPSRERSSSARTAASKDGNSTIWNWLSPFLGHLAQALSFAGLIAFVSAIALNSLLFRMWGLSFLQLASISDVILSGLQLAFLLLVPIGFGLLGWWAVGHARRRWPGDRAKLSWLVLLASAVIGLPLLNQTGWVSGDTTLFVAVLSFVTIGLARAASDGMIPTPESARGRRILIWLWIVLALFQGVLLAVGQFSLVVREGMVGAKLAAPIVAGCAAPTVMWIGERTVVIRCPSRQIHVLYQTEDMQLIPVRSPVRRSTGADDLLRELFGLP